MAQKNREFDFKDKVVLITGGSRGLGLVLARTFAAEGAKLAICARNFEKLAIAKLFGEEPNQQIEEDLQRFKRLIETSSIMKIEGQPSGTQKEQSKTKAMKA